MSLLRTLYFLLHHPLNQNSKLKAFKRFIFWQIGSRMIPGKVIVPFVDKSMLLIKPGMTGATGNIYVGLQEFEEMAFLLHFLRPNDLFVDVGANVGSYTVLASSVVGARSIAIEPIRSTFQNLLQNIKLNHISDFVETLNIGIGARNEIVKFSSSYDTTNRVLTDSDLSDEYQEVYLSNLDSIIDSANPILIKIDVEGYETNVINGADAILSNQSLLAVIIELNGAGKKYGYEDALLNSKMLSYGFNSFGYDPFSKELFRMDGKGKNGNVIYLRNLNEIKLRLNSSNSFYISNTNCRI